MTQQDLPLVSVITPAYNRAQTYLPAVMDSVLAQDYPNFEYIVLDDGSKDNTVELLSSYDDPRLKWESHANMGVVKTVNKAFKMAQGKYVTVVNSDDPVLPNWLTEAVAFMEAHPEVVAGYPDWNMIDENNNVIDHVEVYEYDRGNLLRWGHCMPGPGTLVRKDALEAVGDYREDYPHIFDFEFYGRLIFHGPMARIPKTLANFRVHGASISFGKIGLAMAEERIRMLDEIYSRADLPEDAKAVKSEAYSAGYYIAGLQCREVDRQQAGTYFSRSILLKPYGCLPNGPNGTRRNWNMMLLDYVPSALLPDVIRQPLGKVKVWLRGR